MQFDTTLSLDIVVAILAIVGAVWRLRSDMDSKLSALREELKADNANLRQELKADNVNLREEFKVENANLWQAIKAVEAKVDVSNQRLARLEGVILSREGLVDAITETDPTT